MEQGKFHYLSAVEGFQRLELPYLAASARAYFAREAAWAGLPEAASLRKQAQKAAEKFPDAEQTRWTRIAEQKAPSVALVQERVALSR